MKRSAGKKSPSRNSSPPPNLKASVARKSPLNGVTERLVRSIVQEQQPGLHAYEQLYETAPVGFITLSETGSIRFANAIARTFLTNSSETINGKPFVIFVAYPDIRKFLQHLGYCRLKRARVASEFRLRRRQDDRDVWVEMSSIPAVQKNGEPVIQCVLIDITARKRAETTVQENERRFRALIEYLTEGIVLLTGRGRVFYFSPNVTKLLGYSGVELSAHPPPQIIHPQDFDRARRTFIDLIKRPEAIQELQIRIRHKNGQWRWFNIVVQNLLHEPAVAGIVVNGRDITAQREADLALRRNEEHFRLAQKAGGVGSFDWDIPAATCNISETCAAVLGLDPRRRKISLKQWEARVHSQDRPQMRRHWVRVVAGEEGAAAEYRIVRGRDRAVRWVSSMGRMYRDETGRPYRMVGTLQDITELVEARRVLQRSKEQLEEVVARRTEALRTSEQELTDFFDHSPLGLLWVSKNGRVLRVNRSQEELIGFTSEEILGREISTFLPDPEAAKKILDALNRNETIKNFRVRIKHRKGTVRHVLIDANGFWAKEKFEYSRWFIRDVTDRVSLEKEILLVAERERQRIGRDLHDDLCQQLTGVEFLSQALAGQLNQASGAHAERAREIAKMVRAAITHTRELAHGLSPMRLESLGLRGMLHELCERTKKLFGVRCHFLCKKPLMSEDDAVNIHLYRIAQEAIGNAIKHGKTKRIDIELSRNEKKMVLAVRDYGVGMPRKVRSKGMGLRVMQYRAGVVGGTLQVQSNPGPGTTVSCIVPTKDT
jgi:PAS domain S-box-containing protein